jgi:hypothetical protein
LVQTWILFLSPLFSPFSGVLFLLSLLRFHQLKRYEFFERLQDM